jgi:hypothetical protein
MDRFQYSNLTIVDEDDCIRLRIDQLQYAVIARFPHHGSQNVTAQAIQIAVQAQFGAVVATNDISRFGTDFLLQMHSSDLHRDMVTRGYIDMAPLSPNLIPWNPEYGSVAVLAYSQLSALSNFDHNTFARYSGNPLRQIEIQISGIPPHLCSHTTINALLNKLATVRVTP